MARTYNAEYTHAQGDAETRWAAFLPSFMDNALQALPRQPTPARKRHITQRTVELSEAKADALILAKAAVWAHQTAPSMETAEAVRLSRYKFKEAKNRCRVSVTADLTAFLVREAGDLQTAFHMRHTKALFKKISSLTGKRQPDPISAILHNGTQTTDPQTIAEVFAAHSEATLNVPATVSEETLASAPPAPAPHPAPVTNPAPLPPPPAPHVPEGGRQTRQTSRAQSASTTREANAATDPPAQHSTDDGDNPPTLIEVMAAIQHLKNTAAGNCTVTASMLKFGGNALAEELLHIISAAWKESKCPKSWKEAILTYIHKGKGSKLQPDNYRGISLLSVCGKVYTNIIIARLKPVLEPSLHEAQCGFRPSRGCADQLFSIRRLNELSAAGRAPLFAAFVDYRKAFDSVHRTAMWTLLRNRGVDPHLVDIIEDLYDGCSGEVLVQGHTSRKFAMKTGVRQGCALSPMLFNLFIDHIARCSFPAELEEMGFPIAYLPNGLLNTPGNPRAHPFAIHSRLSFLLYADDLVLVSYSKEGLSMLLKSLQTTSTAWGMTINYKKTQAMLFNPLSPSTELPSPISLNGGPEAQIVFVNTFTYLGNSLTPDNNLDAEIQRRIAMTRRACSDMSKLWKNHHIIRPIKNLLFKAIIPATLLYGCETWALSTQQTHTLDVALHDCLRMSLNITREDRVRNETIRERCQHPDITTITRSQRLRFLGHIARRDNDRFIKRMLFASHTPLARGNPKATRTLIHCFKEDLEVVNRGADWYVECQNRGEWRAMIQELIKDTNPL